ncbi:monovalent cation/H+ antiporter subunit A [Paracoccus chinensis]|uniref:Multisubunit potassium/proton antiporter, PhaA subunit /multisubunit potassium/proton antiporter, PhaB subunit n=1 Tax=Paracoccus chinensis TaxID=525640 RepID=A0A1G9N792_9RHOB|nr:monovalent cation/H+ antiporter subunit A [Paracoccus chinensis]SDL81997.1 multisubunit potassium/proton antiporter, PhaA subunit /multisubunit potassium/proton antiporter, PhaB subunit [Paracoccus chinensis]
MLGQNLLLLLAVLPFLGAILAVTMPVGARNAEVLLAGGVMVAGLLGLAPLAGEVADGGVVARSIEWAPSLGLDMTLRLDGFSWLMLLLVYGIGLMVVIYARYYLSPDDPVPRFYGFLLAFAGAMAGMLMAGNIILMVVFWELTSLFSFLLIGYWHQNGAAREGARTALIVTGAGGLCLLMAMVLLGHAAGSYHLDDVLRAGDRVRAHPWYGWILGLFLIGAFTKSAQFPFHFWLPNAMAAPTPVSAYLHSATMVKAGVFLLVRFSPVLGGTSAWFWVVAGTGMATLLLGAVIATWRNDLKGLLAYSTISHLGLITALAGMGSGGAIVAAIFHIMNHAVFKASLFMAAGIIDHETGTRDMRRLSGLRHSMPRTAALAIVAAAAMAGVPLLNGFLSKEMFFAEAADWHNGTWLDNALPYIATLASVFSVAYSLRFIVSVFFGPPATDLPKEPHEPPTWMRRPVELLVAIVLLVGLWPAAMIGTVLHGGVLAVLGESTPYYSLALWHGFNVALMMSLTALVLGTAVYFVMAPRLSRANEAPGILSRIRGQQIFDRLMLAVTRRWPAQLYRILGSPRLQVQLRLIVLLSLGATAATLWGFAGLVPREWLQSFDATFALLWMAGIACAIGAAVQAKYHRFAALALLGGAGLVTAMTFAWLSAPDLAVTQILVEIMTTVLLLLGLRWLPKRLQEIPGDARLPARRRRAIDLVIASICGAGVAAIAFAVMTVPPGPTIGDWFRRNAYAEGGGTNAVNVILVDFRAFDTLGEITVLGIVALTCYALLRRFRPAPESVALPSQQTFNELPPLNCPREREAEREPTRHDLMMLIPSVIMQWMFPLTVALAMYLFLRGHDLPGGGFAGGVGFAIGLLLQYLATDVRFVESRITILPVRWIGLGLVIAVGTGMGSFLFGYPFMTAHAQYVTLPLIGQVPAATALIFDLGVFATVVGATVLIQIAIAHQSLRSARLRARESADGADAREEREHRQEEQQQQQEGV